MENFTLHILTNEIAPLLIGQRVGKIFQFGVTDVALDLRLRDDRCLFISTDPKRLALYLTARAPKQIAGARTDTAFVALCKKYLSNARLTAIEHLGYDRVVRISLEGEDENEPIIARSLVFQLTGRSANIFVLEGEKILAALRDTESIENIYHEPPPPDDKIDPFDCPPDKLHALIEAHEGDVAAAARLHLIGFGPQFAAEFAARIFEFPPEIVLANLLDEIFSQPPNAVVYSSAPLEQLQIGAEEFLLAFAPIKMEHLRALHETKCPTVNQAADKYFSLLDARRDFLATRQQIESHLTTKLKKLTSLHKNLSRELATFSKGDEQKRFGELLLANLHNAEKEDDAFLVTDYYDAEQRQIKIPAVQKGTAQEAAEHYFKLARKARNGLATINERLPQIAAQVAALQSQIAELKTIHERKALEIMRITVGLARPQQKSEKAAHQNSAKKSKPEKIPGVRRYRSSDGYEILVGRTSRDNDYLTMRVAKSFDIWFHAADYPGSHVILRNIKRSEVPAHSITEAAQLAAKFSQANNDSGAKVAVNFCEKKFVSKPKGFGPGQVRLSAFKTVLVEPTEAGTREF